LVDAVREIVAIYFKNDMKSINTPCGQNAQLQMVKTGGTLGFKGLMHQEITVRYEGCK
jgi:hypothetical protein